MKKQSKDVRFNVRLHKEERKAYKDFCKGIKTTISKRLRKLIELDIEGNLCQEN